jgi:hypothetical protein
VFELLAEHGCSVGYIMEHNVDIDHTHHGDQLIAAGVACWNASRADVLLAWALPENASYATFQRHGFINLPARLSPVEMHLGYRILDTTTKELNRSVFAFSYLDSDTV